MPRLSVSLSLLLPMSLLVSSGRASVIVPLEVPDLVRLADRVVVASVGDGRAHFDDTERRIVTDTELVVHEVLKGGPEARLEVRTSGGVVGELGQQVSGSAVLQRGARVLIFLRDLPAVDTPRPLCQVVGLSRGMFILRTDDGGNEVATQQLPGLEVLDPATGLAHPAQPAALDAQALRRQIRALDRVPAARSR
ncbi:MAG: hypothetical protein ABIJ09_19695 [Pseudomonadota bacterium]